MLQTGVARDETKKLPKVVAVGDEVDWVWVKVGIEGKEGEKQRGKWTGGRTVAVLVDVIDTGIGRKPCGESRCWFPARWKARDEEC